MTANHSIFGRYYDTFERRPPMLAETKNILTLEQREQPEHAQAGADDRPRRHAGVWREHGQLVAGDAGSDAPTRSNIPAEQFFDAPSLGIKLYSYVPGVMAVNVSSAFAFSGASAVGADVYNKAYQASDDLPVRAGTPRDRAWREHGVLDPGLVEFRAGRGQLQFNGRASGLRWRDFFTGQVSRSAARSARHPRQPSVVPGAVRPGHVENPGARDAQRRPSVGAVLRDELRQWRDFQLRPRQLQEGREEHGVRRTRRLASSIPATPASPRERRG